ncbi:response regulator transcription factor [Flavobacterium alkalisoli]|uniref:Response regulator transcription factor n=1 Tax=Flavobacterium alkalisoli TaxID=2602769 RepID=A0A5B9FTM7_9FLAO|nr:response regulator [Flavobacterium alkalisoli]QEE48052.1 response regulator transcription factor [Flavobacterium alkalisoli]
MFKKILITEDIDSINLGLTTALKEKYNAAVSSTKYCDEAFLKIKKAIYEKEPYDLIITDLSFTEDHRESKIASGEELIKTIKAEQSDIGVIVYTIEDRPYKIKSLFEDYKIDAYIIKGRESTQELIEAIDTISKSQKKSTYISPKLNQLLKEDLFFEIEQYDIDLIKNLSKGLTQDEISYLLKKEGKTPSSISSIEKRINKLKIFFKAKNTIHLISIAKDMGII